LADPLGPAELQTAFKRLSPMNHRTLEVLDIEAL